MLSDRSARNFFNQDKTTIAGIIFVQKRAIAPTFYLVKVNSLTSYLLSLLWLHKLVLRTQEMRREKKRGKIKVHLSTHH